MTGCFRPIVKAIVCCFKPSDTEDSGEVQHDHIDLPLLQNSGSLRSEHPRPRSETTSQSNVDVASKRTASPASQYHIRIEMKSPLPVRKMSVQFEGAIDPVTPNSPPAVQMPPTGRLQVGSLYTTTAVIQGPNGTVGTMGGRSTPNSTMA